MTLDAIALCRDRPALPDGLAVLVPGRLAQLCDEGGQPLVTLEGPTLVQVPGEVERLLGVLVDGPVWWVEARARDAAAYDLAWHVVETLATRYRGVAWP